MEEYLPIALMALAVFLGVHLSYWAVFWETRALAWYRLPRCAICNEKCSHVSVVRDKGRPGGFKETPLCDLHLHESLEMHRREAESRFAAEDREGEEWKDA